jgi:TetR/AcrR family transcriptional regulator of autoinduction and epiphytic fitness
MHSYSVGYNVSMVTSTPPKASFKEQMLLACEEAIIQTVNRLLAEKGFASMTVDEVAAEVGIAKASLYKHFPSKEDLACAAMVWVMRRAQAFLTTLPSDAPPLDNLRAVVSWMMGLKLAGEMPVLPSQNSSLRSTLMANKDYMAGLMQISYQLGAWIEAAQAQGSLNAKLPTMVVLYTLYARACDPVLEFLKIGDLYRDEDIIAWVLGTCFEGLNARNAG